MARLPRLDVQGIAHHVTQRVNNRSVCFTSEQDFAAYANWLHEYSIRHRVVVHAWVFMTTLANTANERRCVSIDAIGRPSLSALFQLSISSISHIVGRAFQGLFSSIRALPFRVLSLYRIESSSCRYGGAPWGVKMA
ncbi:MAG: putative transposase [Arenicella sp.]|jgi:putative transposase